MAATLEPITRVEQFLNDIIEQGGGGGGGSGGSGVLIVNVVEDPTEHLDKTWQEIYDAVKSGTPVFIKTLYEASDEMTVQLNLINYVSFWEDDNPPYKVQTDGDTYTCSTANGYPSV